LIDNIELVDIGLDNEFKFVFDAYLDKLGVLITLELLSDWKSVGILIIVEFQSDWKLAGLLSIFVYCTCVKPASVAFNALLFKHWFEAMLKWWWGGCYIVWCALQS